VRIANILLMSKLKSLIMTKYIYKTGFLNMYERYSYQIYNEKFIYYIVGICTLDIITTIAGLNLGMTESNKWTDYFLNFGFYYGVLFMVISKIIIVLLGMQGLIIKNITTRLILFNVSIAIFCFHLLSVISNTYYIAIS
jgi:hypothetical protein